MNFDANTTGAKLRGMPVSLCRGESQDRPSPGR
jgi:hypothetical protein